MRQSPTLPPPPAEARGRWGMSRGDLTTRTHVPDVGRDMASVAEIMVTSPVIPRTNDRRVRGTERVGRTPLSL